MRSVLIVVWLLPAPSWASPKVMATPKLEGWWRVTYTATKPPFAMTELRVSSSALVLRRGNTLRTLKMTGLECHERACWGTLEGNAKVSWNMVSATEAVLSIPEQDGARPLITRASVEEAKTLERAFTTSQALCVAAERCCQAAVPMIFFGQQCTFEKMASALEGAAEREDVDRCTLVVQSLKNVFDQARVAPPAACREPAATP